MIRIVTLGDWDNYYSYFLIGSMEGAILNGAWFRPVQLLGRSMGGVEAQISFFKADIVIAHCLFVGTEQQKLERFAMLRSIRSKGVKVFYHMGDARTEPRYPNNISDIVDYGLVNNRRLEHFENIWGIECFPWPYQCLQQIHGTRFSVGSSLGLDKYDIVFTGGVSRVEGHHHQDRTNLVSLLEKHGLKVKTYPDRKVGNSRYLTPEVSDFANAVLGRQMGQGIYGYQDVRPFQYIGAGALYFHDLHNNMRMFFTPGVHYVEYNGINDLINKIEYYKDNPKKADKIRETGFEYCQKYHSSKVRMKAVIDIFMYGSPKPIKYLEEE